jgi:hypothetical protein
MSSPGFLLANDGNHSLLHSLLDSMNAVIEHQYISKSLNPTQKPTFFPRSISISAGIQESKIWYLYADPLQKIQTSFTPYFVIRRDSKVSNYLINL